MEDILNSTLAGGVIIGTSSDMITYSWLPLLLGVIGGIVSAIGFKKLNAKIGVSDTCGVFNLHGLPGVLGGLAGVIVAVMIGDDTAIGTVFPERGILVDPRSAGSQGMF